MGQKIRSFIIRNHFWRGFFSIYDIWPNRTSFEYEFKDLSPEEIDMLSIKKDWDMIKFDFRNSIEHYEQQAHAS